MKSALETLKRAVNAVRDFLHVTHKLIPQQDPIGKYSYPTHRAKFEHCRPLFEATNPAVS